MSDTLQSFLLILPLSFIFTILLSRIPALRIPSAIGYLIFGIILHVNSAHVSPEELQWLTELGNLGLLFLMFLSGLEVDVSLLRPSDWSTSATNPLRTAFSLFLSTLLLSYGISLILVHFLRAGANPWMITLLLSTTSLGVIVPILEETGIVRSVYGQSLLLAALLADLFTMFLVSLLIAAQTSTHLRDFMLAFTVIPSAIALYFLFVSIQKFRLVRSVLGDVQTRMRAMIAVVGLFCALADFTGAEPILGSFLVGIVVSAIPFAYKQKLTEYMHGIGYGFLIPVFFISVGLNFDTRILSQASSWIWVPSLLLISFAVKVIPAWQLRRQFGRRAAVAGGMLLSARLSLVVAAADIGVRIGAIPEFLSESMVIVAILTSLVAPITFVSLS